MTQLEIATQIFCSGKADEINYAWQLAGELIELDKELQKGLYESLEKALDDDFLTEKDENNLSQRTAERVQILVDLGFEADESLILYKGEISISPKLIEDYNDKEWGYFLETVVDEGDYKEVETLPIIKQSGFMSQKVVEYIDLFKDNPYIEFEMDNSICRLYKLSESLDEKNLAEKDLKTKPNDRKTYLSKEIKGHSENKEFELGITIFKK